MTRPTHLDDQGLPQMVDVTTKAVTRRSAVARGAITLSPEAFAMVASGGGPKGEVLGVARLAGIMAAKRTADWIPLCHPVPLDQVEVRFELQPDPGLGLAAGGDIVCEATARCEAKTGVEMEAMCAVSAALLTVYDMMKAVDRSMVIHDIRLVLKTGGRSGTFQAAPP